MNDPTVSFQQVFGSICVNIFFEPSLFYQKWLEKLKDR